MAVRGSLILGTAARPTVSGMGLASVAASAGCVSVSAWTDYALLFVLLPFALCIFSFLIRAKRGFEKWIFWCHASTKISRIGSVRDRV